MPMTVISLGYPQVVEIPCSEAAMHLGIVGQRVVACEEDIYVNGRHIPPEKRNGCYVFVNGRNPIPLLKSEAGWPEGATGPPHPATA